MKTKSILLGILAIFINNLAHAVQLSQHGSGEVLIYPYYTVNNNLNTLYSVVNTTGQAKAIRVDFREGEIGRSVLRFNVYLSPYDVWTGALVASNSTIFEHEGELSGTHITNDLSCAPFLTRSGQEFLPYEIDIDAPNNNMLRAREGHIEVIELATFSGETADAIDQGNYSVPANCTAVADFWGFDGEWTGDIEGPVTGGLLGTASLVDVAEGVSFSYDAIAFEDFWGQEDVVHTAPGSSEPNLSSAYPVSKLFLNNGQVVISNWATGFEALSAVLMQSEIYNEYAYDTFIFGKSEWVVTFPTKFYHVNNDADTAISPSPFRSLWDGFESCDWVEFNTYDRESSDLSNSGGSVLRPPGHYGPELCYSANVIGFLNPMNSSIETTDVLGSENKIITYGVYSINATENGWATLKFLVDGEVLTPLSGIGFKGLPAVGFAVQKYTNAGAAEGLLAQYGSLFIHKGIKEIDSPEE